MQSISDVVFGLALSIGSVILIAKLPQNPGELGADVLAFGFNFLLVVLVWLGYRRAIVTLPHETPATVMVNVALLFAVSIEPFLFVVLLSVAAMLEPASMAYALDIGSMLLLQAALNHVLLVEERASPRKGLPSAVLERVRHRMWAGIGIGILFLVSALPIFWLPTAGSTLRMDLWYAGVVLILVLPRLSMRRRNRHGGP